MGESFGHENDEEHGVGVIDVEHQAGDSSKDAPLEQVAVRTGFVPIPKKKRHGEGGVRVRPGRIEIHVDGERAGPPDREGGEEGPTVRDVVAGEAKGQQQTEKAVNAGTDGHGDAVGNGKTIGGDVGSQSASEQYGAMSDQQEGSPKEGGADGEVIIEMAGDGAVVRVDFAVGINAALAKAVVGEEIVVLEVEAVLDERSAGEGVVADAVSADPGIQEGEG